MLSLIPYPARTEEVEGSSEISADEYGAPEYERVYDGGMPPESYELTIANGVKIKSGSESGFRYAETTLNLIASDGRPGCAVKIYDSPVWTWR